MLKYKSGKEWDVGHCTVGAQMWEVLAVVSTEDRALSCLGEAWQACTDIWISEAVTPRELVPSAKLHWTDTCVAGRRGVVA